jgi:hypothetical protein
MTGRAVALLAILCSAASLLPTQASAYGWYGVHRHREPAGPCYFRGPRWNYAAAHSTTHPHATPVERCRSHRGVVSGSAGGPAKHPPTR